MTTQRSGTVEDVGACRQGQPTTLTTADAAAVLNVSRSTVQRAIRAGRLAATRTGSGWRIERQALDDFARTRLDGQIGRIDDAHAETWRSAIISLLDQPDSRRALEAACRILRERLNGTSAVLWQQDVDQLAYSPVVASGNLELERDPYIDVRTDGLILSKLDPGWQRISLRSSTAQLGNGDVWVAPLRTERRVGAIVTVAGENIVPDIDPDLRPWLDAVSGVIRSRLDQLRWATREVWRDSQLSVAIDEYPDPAAMVDADGCIHSANAQFLSLFDLTRESLAVGVNLITVVNHAEQASDHRALKRSLVPRLRDALASGTRSLLPLAFLPGRDGRHGPGRMTVVPVMPRGDESGHPAGALIRVSSVRPVGNLDAGQTAREPGPTIDLARMVELVSVLGANDQLEDTLATGMDELIDLFGATAGSILLRRPDSTLVRMAPRGFRDTAMLTGEVDDEATPIILKVVNDRRPELLRRSTSGPEDLHALNEVESDAALVIPLMVGDDVIGLVSLLFFAEPDEFPDALFDLAGVLGQYLSTAISNSRNWQRWGDAQHQLRAIIDQIPHAIVAVDGATGELTIANQAASQLWGYDLVGDLEGSERPLATEFLKVPGLPDRPVATERLPIFDQSGESFPPGESPLEVTMVTGESRLGELLTIRRPDQTMVPVIANRVPLRDDDRVVGAIMVLESVEQLRAVDRSRDEFLSVVAHELRNPLTALRGNMQLLLRRLRRQNDESRQDEIERLERLVSQTDRIADLVRSLLDMSRADLGRISLDLQWFNAAELIGEALLTARGLATNHRVTAEETPDVEVHWDRLRIDQVLDNLLSNAVKHTPGGEIHLRLSVDGDWVTITVQDQGEGIPDDIKRRMFERYFRGNVATRGEGLGIGLFISSRIVAAHHGVLSVEDAPGGGSLFAVRLPIDADDGTDDVPDDAPSGDVTPEPGDLPTR